MKLASMIVSQLLPENMQHVFVRRSEHSNVRNLILEEGQIKLTAAVTRRKTILSGKRKIVDGKHILTTSEIHDDLVEVKK